MRRYVVDEIDDGCALEDAGKKWSAVLTNGE